MTEDRIQTELWLQAHLRRLATLTIPAYVTHRGDPRGGLVTLKLLARDGSVRVLTQSRDMDGRRVWLGAQKGAAMAEADADAYISRAVARDPDLWVVEVEDRDGRHPFDDPVV